MRSAECDEIAGLFPAYVLEALNPTEQAQVEAHVTVCPPCLTLLSEYQALAEALLYTSPPVTAPAYLEADLRRRLAAVKSPKLRKRFLSRLRSWLIGRISAPAWPALALSLLLLLLLVASNLYWLRTTRQLQEQLARLMEALSAQEKGVRVLAAGGYPVILRGDAPAPEAVGVLILVPDQREAVLFLEGLPPPPLGKQYQLWLVHAGQGDNGGLFTVDASGRGVWVVRSPRPWKEYQAVGATVEPAGGSPGPTSPRVIGGRLQ